MIHTIDSDNPIDVVLLEFWELGDIPDQNGSHNILICLDCIKLFGLGSAIGMKEITSDQAARRAFGNFFVPFGLPEMIVVDADRLFLEFSRKLSKRPY